MVTTTTTAIDMGCTPTPFSAALGLLITLSVLGFVATLVIYLTKWGTSAADSARKKGHDSHFHTGSPASVRGPPLRVARGGVASLALVPGCRGTFHPLHRAALRAAAD